jgi:hypothetical protein
LAIIVLANLAGQTRVTYPAPPLKSRFFPAVQKSWRARRAKCSSQQPLWESPTCLENIISSRQAYFEILERFAKLRSQPKIFGPGRGQIVFDSAREGGTEKP